jgi:sulfur transfer complex TusBCD TusB component (DsrH family)
MLLDLAIPADRNVQKEAQKKLKYNILNEGITMCLEINEFMQNLRQHNIFILE